MTDTREAREALIAVAMEAEGCTVASRSACEMEYGGNCACIRLADDALAALSEAGITLCRERVVHHAANGEPLTTTRVYVPISED